MEKRKIIIDCDGGSDDAMAIAMALGDPRYQILLVSTVCGNVPAAQAAKNVLATLEAAESDEPPVYIGCTKPFFQSLGYAAATHGVDGMGDLGFAPTRLQIAEGHGVLKILEALRNEPENTVEIIAMGPLTNLAIAMRLEPETMHRVKRISIMGSAGLGRGNVSPVAEFNIWQDAEAAKIVLDFGIPFMMVGWDASLGDSVLRPEDLDALRESCPLGRFTVDCNHVLRRLNEVRFGEAFLDMADPAAMAAALYEDCIAECDKYYCQIDISNGPSYGSVLVDANRFTGKEPNAWICSKLHPELYKKYIFETINKTFGK